VRFFAGPWADAYLQRRPPQPGTVVIVFRGRHVADPCDFTDEELAGYWADVRTIAKAIDGVYGPGQLNYMTFGNAVPHVHTHIVPRYPDDPAPGRPLPDEVFQNAPALADTDLADQVARLRHHLLWAAAI
jgi:diadenosine tetraphosphate (Ap4A) HIT family hydrolase